MVCAWSLPFPRRPFGFFALVLCGGGEFLDFSILEVDLAAGRDAFQHSLVRGSRTSIVERGPDRDALARGSGELIGVDALLAGAGLPQIDRRRGILRARGGVESTRPRHGQSEIAVAAAGLEAQSGIGVLVCRLEFLRRAPSTRRSSPPARSIRPRTI